MKKLLIISIVCILFFIIISIGIFFYSSKSIIFKIDAPSNTNIPVLVEN